MLLRMVISGDADDAEKMTIEQAKTLHDEATVSLRGGLIDHKRRRESLCIFVINPARLT